MNEIRNILISLILLFGVFQNSYGQVVIVPTQTHSEIFQFDQLFQVNVLNTTAGQVSGQMEITIENKALQSVFKIRSLPIILLPSSTRNGTQINWETSPQYGGNPIAELFSETGKLAFGEYVICYRFLDSSGGSVLGVNCQEKSIKPFGQPELISPYNEEVIQTKYPVLTWRAPLPTYNFNITYRLILTELKKGQSPQQALRRNVPMIRLENINRNSMLYPTSARPLEVGKTYVWQVTAFYEQWKIGVTDIWTFRVEDVTEMMPPSDESYANLKRKLDAGYYIAENGKILFKIEERYNANSFTYKIYDSSRTDLTSTTSITDGLPHKFGFNYYTIDFPTSCSSAYIGQFLTLEITTESGEKSVLRFKIIYTGSPC